MRNHIFTFCTLEHTCMRVHSTQRSDAQVCHASKRTRRQGMRKEETWMIWMLERDCKSGWLTARVKHSPNNASPTGCSD